MVRTTKPKAAAKTAKGAKTVTITSEDAKAIVKACRKPSKIRALADAITDARINADEKALFLHHLPIIEAAKIRVENVRGDLKRLMIAAKADGFSAADFTYAIEVQTPEREQASKETIARRLTIAGFMGSDLGLQLDLFQEPSRVPASDRAYQEGRTRAMQNQPAKPSYDPSTEQYREYLRGFHDVSAATINSGFTPFTADEMEHQQDLADEASKH